MPRRTPEDHHSIRWSEPPSLRSFSLVELIIVVGIIAALAGILLPALAGASRLSREAKTKGVLNQFIRACERFHADHGFHPGIIPDPILAFNNHEIAEGGSGYLGISGTENALLHLMGGYVLRDEVDQPTWDGLLPSDGWHTFSVTTPIGQPILFKFNMDEFGRGPVINGRRFEPYLSPDEGQISIADFYPSGLPQWPYATDDESNNPNLRLPDLLDAWGTPILYFRQSRDVGPLAGDAHTYAIFKPQFYIDSNWPYLRAPRQMWSDPCGGGNGDGSILSTGHPHGGGGFGPQHYSRALARLMQHPAFDDGGEPLNAAACAGVVAISAGADGVYFSASDGPGAGNTIGNSGCQGSSGPLTYDQFLSMGPAAFDLFDDIVVRGGALD